MRYTIGSWNACRLGTSTRKDYDMIANIILQEKFDVIALQEVFKPEILNPLKSRLFNWEVAYGRPAFGRSGDFGFAYLWNKNRLDECSKDKTPEILTRESSGISRSPFYGRFTPLELLGGGFFEIRLINIHLHFGADDVLSKQKRIEEFKLVTNQIYTYLSKHRYGNFKPSYTIILGDYNLNAVHCQIVEKENKPPCIIETKQQEKTTISDKGYANDYDHFSYEPLRFNGLKVDISRVDSVYKFLGGDFAQHKNIISDHVPIKFELEF
jgi:endonuclease/exonuclease/phosphatase family metal-dependent hydrolase